MATCSKCNTQQPDGLNYCIKCGNPFGSAKPKKSVPKKGLLLGGCGCALLSAIIIGIVIVLVIVFISLQRRGSGAMPQPMPPALPQLPTQPTPAVPQKPVAPQQPTLPTQPTQPQIPQQPVAPQPTAGGVGELKQGEFTIQFTKGLSADGTPVGTTTTFSVNDPMIILMLRWGPNTVPDGAYVIAYWYYNSSYLVWTSSYCAKEGRLACFDKVDKPANGFPQGEYTVYVTINGSPIIDHKFIVR